jgi:hypothetical protein
MIFFAGLTISAVAKDGNSKIQKLAREADVIVTGKVKEKTSDWNENKTRIYTRATLDVDEYLKGKNDGQAVEIVYPGGEIGEVGELYTHMPKFEENEEVLVFLKKDKKNKSFRVVDGEAGKIKVIFDAEKKEKVTTSNMKIRAIKAEIKKHTEQK